MKAGGCLEGQAIRQVIELAAFRSLGLGKTIKELQEVFEILADSIVIKAYNLPIALRNPSWCSDEPNAAITCTQRDLAKGTHMA